MARTRTQLRQMVVDQLEVPKITGTAGGSGSDMKITGLEPKVAEKLKEALAGKIANEDV